MLPVLGLIIGLYCSLRYVDIATRSSSGFVKVTSWILLPINLLLTISLFTAGLK